MFTATKTYGTTNHRRPLLLVAATFALLLFTQSSGASAAVFGQMNEIPGPGGCIASTGASSAWSPPCSDKIGLGMEYPNRVEVSPDGEHLYTAAYYSSSNEAIALFDRDKDSGELQQLPGTSGCIINDSSSTDCSYEPLLNYLTDITLSPDGRQLYAVSSRNGVLTFDRDLSTGELTLKSGNDGCITDVLNTTSVCSNKTGVGLVDGYRIIISPDGSNTYVATSYGAIAMFDRDTTTGVLTQKSGSEACITAKSSAAKSGCPNETINSIDRYLRQIEISSDGKSLYGIDTPVSTASYSRILLFERDASSGVIKQLAGKAGCISGEDTAGTCTKVTGPRYSASLTLSTDGRDLYLGTYDTDGANGYGAGAIFGFTRDTTTGELTLKSGKAACIAGKNYPLCSNQTAIGIGFPYGMQVNPDGSMAYMADIGGPSIAAFTRDSSTGELVQLPGKLGCVTGVSTASSLGCDGYYLGLRDSDDIALDPAGNTVYAVNNVSESLIGFSLSVPKPRVDSDKVEFGSVVRGYGEVKTVDVVNEGDVAAVFDGFTVTGPQASSFTVVSEECTKAPVAPGDSCEVELEATPIAASAHSATLVIESNEPVTAKVDLSVFGLLKDLSETPAKKPSVEVVSDRIGLISSDGTFKLKLRCVAGTSDTACSGTVGVTLSGKILNLTTPGKGFYSIAAGESKAIEYQLTSELRSELRREGKLAGTVSLTPRATSTATKRITAITLATVGKP